MLGVQGREDTGGHGRMAGMMEGFAVVQEMQCNIRCSHSIMHEEDGFIHWLLSSWRMWEQEAVEEGVDTVVLNSIPAGLQVILPD